MDVSSLFPFSNTFHIRTGLIGSKRNTKYISAPSKETSRSILQMIISLEKEKRSGRFTSLPVLIRNVSVLLEAVLICSQE